MCDISSLTVPELRSRMGDLIARRLDAETAEDRARSGHELLCVLDELGRRGCLDGRSAPEPRGVPVREPRPAVDEVPVPRASGTTSGTTSGSAFGTLVLQGAGGGPAHVHPRSAAD